MLQSERDVGRGDATFRAPFNAYVHVLSSPSQGALAIIIFGYSEFQPSGFIISFSRETRIC